MDSEIKFNQELAKNVREARERNGFSHVDVADIIGLSRQSIVNIERGRASTSIYNMALLMKAMGVEMPQVSDLVVNKKCAMIKKRAIEKRKKKIASVRKAIENLKKKEKELAQK